MSPTALSLDPARVGDVATTLSSEAEALTTASVRIVATFSAATAGRIFTDCGATLHTALHQRRSEVEELAQAVRAAGDGLTAQLDAHTSTDDATAQALSRSDAGAHS